MPYIPWKRPPSGYTMQRPLMPTGWARRNKLTNITKISDMLVTYISLHVI
jgi:hypothetical protein